MKSKMISGLAVLLAATAGCSMLTTAFPVTDYQKGLQLERRGRYAEALRYYEKSNDVDALHRRANIHQTGKGGEFDHVKAFALWRQAAERGDTAAWYNLGLCYRNGNGVAQNRQKARECFETALKAGDTESAQELAELYQQDGSPDTALKYRRIAADGGNAKAQLNLALASLDGDGVPADASAAFRYFLAAARQGNPLAQENTAKCYFSGTGVEKSLPEAFAWWKKAADQGYAKAQFALAVCLFKGLGCSPDPEQGQLYLEKACRQNDADALRLKGQLPSGGR